jgi:hypothetical protein
LSVKTPKATTTQKKTMKKRGFHKKEVKKINSEITGRHYFGIFLTTMVPKD